MADSPERLSRKAELAKEASRIQSRLSQAAGRYVGVPYAFARADNLALWRDEFSPLSGVYGDVAAVVMLSMSYRGLERDDN